MHLDAATIAIIALSVVTAYQQWVLTGVSHTLEEVVESHNDLVEILSEAIDKGE